MNVYRAALYIRLSREDGDREESDSVANQRKLLTGYVQQRDDLVLEEIYVDDGFSGTNFRRPAFCRMTGDIEEGRINCVIVKDLSRFGRDYIDTGRYLERYFPERGVRFISVTDGIDSLERDYDMLLPIKNIFNEQYARDISKKIQATVRSKQRAGEFIGAFPCYGYKKSPADKNRLVIDPYAAGIVRRIFEWYLEGRGKQEIADLLNREGVLCPSAYKASEGMRYSNPRCTEQPRWTYSTVNSILRRETYLGNMVQGTRHQTMRGKQKRVEREQWIVVENTHQPVIDREVWEKAQELLRKRTRSAPRRRRENLFAGLLKCGDCGGTMVRNTWRRADGQETSAFYCGNYRRFGRKSCTAHALPEEILEAEVKKELRKLLDSAGDLRQPEDGSGDGRQAEERELRRERRELSRVRRMKQGVYEDYREGLLTEAEYLSYCGEYRRREALWVQKIREAESRMEAEEKPDGKRMQSGQFQELDREIVVELVREVTVYQDRRIRICYNFSEVQDPAQTAPFPWRERSGEDRRQSDGGENAEFADCPETERAAGEQGDYGCDDQGGGRRPV